MRFNNSELIGYLRKMEEFLEKYKGTYNELEEDFIRKNFGKLEIDNSPDILLQLYANFGMLSKRENFYLGFANMVGKKYGYDCNILEIGGGYYPMFAKYMSNLQKYHNGKGEVTVYDPSLITTDIGNLKLYKQEFNEEIDISDYDLVVGILSCDATKVIIDQATSYNKEFFIALCGCLDLDIKGFPRSSFGVYPYSYKNLVDTLYRYASFGKSNDFKFSKQYVKSFNYPYPIISSKKIRYEGL